jgi:CheY-specific phosphatase CheX
MKQALTTAMMTSISEVLETMFFMSLECTVDQTRDSFLSAAPSELSCCRIQYDGKVSGHFEFFMPESILAEMTSGFMGLEEDQINAQQLEGTLQEALNMIAGSTFTNFDNQAVFQLGIPETADLDTIHQSGMSSDQENIFILVNTMDGDIGLNLVYQSS